MSNPYLQRSFADVPSTQSSGSVMTVGGTVGKTMVLALLMLLSLAMCWLQVSQSGSYFGINPSWAMIGSAIAGLVAVLLATFVPALVIPMSVIYSLLQGIFLGVLTLVVNTAYPGLPMIAAGATATTLVGVLILYQTGILRATPAFIKIVAGATVGLLLFVGAVWLMSLFGMTGLRDTIYGSGPIGIGFSLLCVGLAALNLVLDFHVIEKGAENRAPKRMEWRAALGLMITLIWLYIEILRLLMKLRSR